MTLILSVLALAAGLAVTEARAQGVAEEVRQPVTLARWALRHIQQVGQSDCLAVFECSEKQLGRDRFQRLINNSRRRLTDK